MTREEVIRHAGVPGNGKLTEMLKVLEQCDFIRSYSVPGKEKHERVFQLIETGTKNAVHLTMVSANGLKRNANAFDIQSVVTLDDLFAR